MKRSISYVTLLVQDYDDAIAFFTRILPFDLVEDRKLSETKRWVLVAPTGGVGTSLLLAEPNTEEQRSALGEQCGGRVAFFLETDDFDSDYRRMKEKGVIFTESPRDESYGKVVVFTDISGNRWDLLQLNPSSPTQS